ncbi:hypothetical protein GCM10010252_11450 [Streptomyces aureoverticillatus]|nr:hypothetical protein GCM10010252_11450 [Streptomyces aureoverticillatus]
MGVPPLEGQDGDYSLPSPPHVHNSLPGHVAGPVVQAGVIQNVTVHYRPDNESSQPDEATPTGVLGAKVPRTAAGIAEIRRSRPNLWEYLLYAGELHVGLEGLEAKFLDHTLGHRITGQVIADEAGAIDRLQTAFQDLEAVSADVERWMSQEAQTRAFGPPGTPGDPELITHIARRLLAAYESLMDWAVAMRSVRPPSTMVALFEVASRYSQASIEGFREFVTVLVGEVDQASDVLARQDGSTAHIDATYTMTISPEVIKQFDREQRRLGRRQWWRAAR